MIRNALALTVLSVAAFAAEAPLLSLVEPGAKAIGGLHADRALSSPLGRYLVAQIRDDDPQFRKLLEATGFDPRQDVREVVVAQSQLHAKGGILIARGVFDGPRILAAAQTHGATSATYNGVPLVSSKRGQMIAFLDGSIALLGEEQMVKYAIDHRRDTNVPSAALIQKANTLAGRYDGWLVASGAVVPPVPGNGTRQPAPAVLLQGIQETSAGLELGSTVRVSGEAVTRSDKDAQALVDVIRFMATMLRNNSANNPDVQRLEPVLNSLDVRAEAATVKLSVAIPESDLEQWLKPKRTSTRASVN